MGKVKGRDENRLKLDQSPSRDVRSWFDEVESLGLLETVEGADWDEEIGAITDTNVKKNKYTLLLTRSRDIRRDSGYSLARCWTQKGQPLLWVCLPR